MLRKDMRCADEQEDDTSSVESFPDIPNTRVNGMFWYLVIQLYIFFKLQVDLNVNFVTIYGIINDLFFLNGYFVDCYERLQFMR